MTFTDSIIPLSPDAIHMYHHLIWPCVLLCSGLFCHQVFPFIVSFPARVRHSCESYLGAKLSEKMTAWYLKGFFSFFFWLVIIIGLQLDMRMWSLCFVKYNCRVKDEGTNLREGSCHIKRGLMQESLWIISYCLKFVLCSLFGKKKSATGKKQTKTIDMNCFYLNS